MHEENLQKTDLHLRKESIKPSPPSYPQQSKLPSGSISISTKGDQLLIRPSSPYRYNFSPSDLTFSNTIEEIKDDKLHQRSTTTVINDISQSYTFIQTGQDELESFSEHLSGDGSFKQMYKEIKDSVMAKTRQLGRFVRRGEDEHGSSVFVGSRGESEDLGRGRERVEIKHVLFEPVTAFCSKCGKNVKTVVVKKRYVGSL